MYDLPLHEYAYASLPIMPWPSPRIRTHHVHEPKFASVVHEFDQVSVRGSHVILEGGLQILRIHCAAGAEQIANGSFQIINANRMPEHSDSRRQANCKAIVGHLSHCYVFILETSRT